MKALVSSIKWASIVLVCLSCVKVNAQSEYKTFRKKPIPIIADDPKKEYTSMNPYFYSELAYHGFQSQCEDPWPSTSEKLDWYMKYKAMFDFRCKEPFWGASPTFTKNDYMTSGYKFRLVDNQMLEDSIQFLWDKYPLNNADTLKIWNLPPNTDHNITEKIIKRLGINHFKFVITVFNSRKYGKWIEVPEAEQANDNMVYMEVFKYPADVDIFLFNFEKNNWEYVESVTVSGDHELELYVLQKFEPRYLKNCE
ncbi:hypothetical protein FACS1894201_09170 [Bacteroidia bacterium]|nr:hypothetical protein FACS1894201_09170 [Bacteroidia bacterium]